MLRNTFGVLLILIGLVGWIAPIVPGLPLMIVGIGLIQHPWKTSTHEWLKERSKWYRWVALKGLNIQRKLRKSQA